MHIIPGIDQNFRAIVHLERPVIPLRALARGDNPREALELRALIAEMRLKRPAIPFEHIVMLCPYLAFFPVIEPVVVHLENKYPNWITRATGSVCRYLSRGIRWLTKEDPISEKVQRPPQNKEVSLKDIEKDVCPISYDSLRKLAKKGELVETSCGHKYSRSCITKWLDQKPECPACREPNTKEDLINITLKTKKVAEKNSALKTKKESKKPKL